jgi:hypothetical protein
VGIYLYLLSDLPHHVNGQIIGLRPEGGLCMARHPVNLMLTAKPADGVWIAMAIGEAIDKGLVTSLQPLGFAGLRQPRRRWLTDLRAADVRRSGRCRRSLAERGEDVGEYRSKLW